MCIVIGGNYKHLKNHLDRTFNSINNIQKGDYNNSTGLRLQMWKSAYLSMSEFSLLGFGDKYIDEVQKQHKAGLVEYSLVTAKLSHYHNQYFDRSVKTGIIGFCLFIWFNLHYLLLSIFLSK